MQPSCLIGDKDILVADDQMQPGGRQCRDQRGSVVAGLPGSEDGRIHRRGVHADALRLLASAWRKSFRPGSLEETRCRHRSRDIIPALFEQPLVDRPVVASQHEWRSGLVLHDPGKLLPASVLVAQVDHGAVGPDGEVKTVPVLPAVLPMPDFNEGAVGEIELGLV